MDGLNEQSLTVWASTNRPGSGFFEKRVFSDVDFGRDVRDYLVACCNLAHSHALIMSVGLSVQSYRLSGG